MITFTHPLRLFRPTVAQKHDLSAVFTAEDLYGHDVWGRLVPDDSTLFELDGPSQFGVLQVTARLMVRGDVDVDTGYFVQVKRPRVLGGKREPCAAVLTGEVLAGATEIPVDSSVGFRCGDQVLFSAEGVRQLSRLQTVAEGRLTLYPDKAVEKDLPVGAEVVACSFYRVIHRRMPKESGPIQVLTLQEIMGTGGMA